MSRLLIVFFFGILGVGGSAFAVESIQGIVAYKKTPNHPDQNANLVTFRSYEYADPRYRFYTGSGAIEVTRFQGPAIYVMTRIDDEPKISSRNLTGIQAQLEAARLFVKRFPSAKPSLDEEIKSLSEALQRLKLGQEKIDDLWLSREDAKTYLSSQQPKEVRKRKIHSLKQEIQRCRSRLRNAERSAQNFRSTLRLLQTELQDLENAATSP